MELALNKLPWKVQVGVFLAVAVAALGGFYWYYVQGAQDTIATQQKKLDGMLAEAAKANATARQLKGFQSQVAELTARLDNLRAVLPEEKDVGDLLRRLQTLATQSNLTIRCFTPATITRREMHAEWPIGLKLEGSYHDLGTFLERVSKFPRIINVGAMHIAARPSQTATATVTAECTAMTFVLVKDVPDGKKKSKAAAPAAVAGE